MVGLGWLAHLRHSRRTRPAPHGGAPTPRHPTRLLTIVTPSFEGHAVQFGRLVESIATHCRDRERLVMTLVVEQRNVELFEGLFAGHDIEHAIVTTEAALAAFDVSATPAAFLRRVGKFTFQTIKKLHALNDATTAWSLVLDSETLFVKPFGIEELVEDYTARKYVFYSNTAPRGEKWVGALGKAVIDRCARATGVRQADRWYIEYFHWFYETDKVRAMLGNGLRRTFWRDVRDAERGRADYFEPVLYYQYLERHHPSEYEFLEIFALLRRYLPAELANRFVAAELPFSQLGNEYLLNVLRPEEVSLLAPLFAAYRLPFLRLEPPLVSHRYIAEAQQLPSFCAFVSSQHIAWLRGQIAVCVSDGFAGDAARLHAQLRTLVGFLSGVECDIFVHGRAGLDESAICNTLRATVAQFEDVPDFEDLLDQVSTAAPREVGRDHEDLWRLYSDARCFALIGDPAGYEYIVKLRPGLVGDLSLKEIMFAISEDGDVLPDMIYLPRALHGRGVNVDMALGPVGQMRQYMTAFDYVVAHRADHAFDPHLTLLTALLAGGCRITLAEMAYSDMGHEPPRINSTYERFHEQFAAWWGRNEDAPPLHDATAHFAQKLLAHAP